MSIMLQLKLPMNKDPIRIVYIFLILDSEVRSSCLSPVLCALQLAEDYGPLSG